MVFEPVEGGENFDPWLLCHPRSLDDLDCSFLEPLVSLKVHDTGKDVPPCWRPSVEQDRDLKSGEFVAVE